MALPFSCLRLEGARGFIYVLVAFLWNLGTEDFAWAQVENWIPEPAAIMIADTGFPPSQASHVEGTTSTENRWPGLAASIVRLAQGRVQIEGGYTFIADEPYGMQLLQHTYPDLLLRVGLTERLELRLGWPGYLSQRLEDNLAHTVITDETSVEPTVGVMLDLYSQYHLIPQTAIQASIPIPRGGSLVEFDSLQPLVSGLYGWSIGERWAITGSTAMTQVEVEGDDFLQFQQLLGLDVCLTDTLVAFIEWDCLLDRGALDDGVQHMLVGGIGLPLTSQSQVIVRAGFGLNERAPDLRAGIRVVYWF